GMERAALKHHVVGPLIGYPAPADNPALARLLLAAALDGEKDRLTKLKFAWHQLPPSLQTGDHVGERPRATDGGKRVGNVLDGEVAHAVRSSVGRLVFEQGLRHGEAGGLRLKVFGVRWRSGGVEDQRYDLLQAPDARVELGDFAPGFFDRRHAALQSHAIP